MATATINIQDHPYNDLREAGMALLRDKAGAVWTDHNEHDPGITILESLCYAITELLLKTGLDIPTLLGRINKDPAWPELPEKTSLFNSPLIGTDYRKLLLVHEFAKNAWLTPLECPGSLFFDGVTKTLSPDNPSGLSIPFLLKGLNSVLFELEDALPGAALPATDTDLNNNVISRPGVINPPGEPAIFDIAFPFWDEAPVLCSGGLPLNPITATVNNTAVPLSYLVTLQFNLTTGAGPVSVTLGVYVNVLSTGLPLTSLPADQAAAIKALLQNTAAGAPVPVFLEKMKRTKIAVDALIAFVHQYRNLSEDPATFMIIRTQEIAMEADLRLDAAVVPELVLAKIYLALEGWFTPTIPFHTAAELQARGLPVEEIYEGPDLNGVFVDDADLPLADQESSIHVSDLVNIFMLTGGVQALEDLGISNYVNNLVVTSHEHNCLVLVSPRLYKPRFSRAKSVLRIYQDNILRTLDPVLIDTYITSLKAAAVPAPALAPPPAVPSSPDRTAEIRSWYSIQNEFPAVYGLKEGELSGGADALRTAQSLQLKAYLALFEQGMANYAAQLGHFSDLFSIDPAIVTTFASQPLYQVPGVPAILNAFMDGGYVDWDAFVGDTGNAYALAVGNTDSGFTARRNLFLDHLLGRLGHAPDDFTAWRFNPTVDVEKKIIAQKCRFLRDFPLLSSERGKSWCYLAEPGITVWDTVNVTGLEKRLAHLLDIQDFKRQDLGATKEGFFLVEHILLRPLPSEPAPVPFLLPEAHYADTGDGAAWMMDPYSFRITVVFPALLGRFQNDEFQRRAERILAIETPAHIVPEAYWITDLAVQTAWETALHAWLDLQSLPFPAEEPARGAFIANWSAAKAAVIKFLNHFRSAKFSTDPIPVELAPPYKINTLPV